MMATESPCSLTWTHVALTALVFLFTGWLMIGPGYEFFPAAGMSLAIPAAVMLIGAARPTQLRVLLLRLLGHGQR
jgi:hypothetical protein